ncbi:hypothetical protein AXF24_12515 [Streptococcus pneumoniae]|nr:hypothetical protein AWW74_12530 [Streptococcus pneumoniae]KXB94834.1 hypothetical protein AXF24_12515 [Streptococcus pneumoniae]
MKTKYQINKERIEQKAINRFCDHTIRRILVENSHNKDVLKIPTEIYRGATNNIEYVLPAKYLIIYGREYKLY